MTLGKGSRPLEAHLGGRKEEEHTVVAVIVVVAVRTLSLGSYFRPGPFFDGPRGTFNDPWRPQTSTHVC